MSGIELAALIILGAIAAAIIPYVLGFLIGFVLVGLYLVFVVIAAFFGVFWIAAQVIGEIMYWVFGLFTKKKLIETNEDWDSCKCDYCGQSMESVRPGKWQCNHCEGNHDE